MLYLSTLREANLIRLPQFRNNKGKIAHSEKDGSDWSIDQWGQAVIGEIGEYANIRKKYDRGDLTREEYEQQAADELADIAIYLDLFHHAAGYQDFAAIGPPLQKPDEVEPAIYLFHFVGAFIAAWNTCRDGNTTRFTDCLSWWRLCDLAYYAVDTPLRNAIVSKFNRTSLKVGADVFLVLSTQTGQVGITRRAPKS